MNLENVAFGAGGRLFVSFSGFGAPFRIHMIGVFNSRPSGWLYVQGVDLFLSKKCALLGTFGSNRYLSAPGFGSNVRISGRFCSK